MQKLNKEKKINPVFKVNGNTIATSGERELRDEGDERVGRKMGGEAGSDGSYD